MKIRLALLILCLSSLLVNAEIVEIANYIDGFDRQKSIKMNIKDGKPTSIIIPCEREDESVGYILQPINFLFALVDYLNDMKQKYIEWTDVTIENGVQTYQKDLPSSGFPFGFLWYNPEERNGKSDVTASWYYSEDSNIIVASAKNVFDSNSYDKENFYLSFSSVEDIDNLLNAISKKNIKAPTPTTVDDLFK